MARGHTFGFLAPFMSLQQQDPCLLGQGASLLPEAFDQELADFRLGTGERIDSGAGGSSGTIGMPTGVQGAPHGLLLHRLEHGSTGMPGAAVLAGR